LGEICFFWKCIPADVHLATLTDITGNIHILLQFDFTLNFAPLKSFVSSFCHVCLAPWSTTTVTFITMSIRSLLWREGISPTSYRSMWLIAGLRLHDLTAYPYLNDQCWMTQWCIPKWIPCLQSPPD
jgi:hypothetical protein